MTCFETITHQKTYTLIFIANHGRSRWTSIPLEMTFTLVSVIPSCTLCVAYDIHALDNYHTLLMDFRMCIRRHGSNSSYCSTGI